MRLSHPTSCFSALLLFGLLSCSSNREARTPQEFVAKYSKAWKSGDVESILAMRSQKPLVDIDLKPEMKKELEDASLADEKEEIEQSIKRRDFAYLLWAEAAYVSHEDHQDHIHVSVSVGSAHSTIVLVREGDLLRIHPRPSLFR